MLRMIGNISRSRNCIMIVKCRRLCDYFIMSPAVKHVFGKVVSSGYGE